VDAHRPLGPEHDPAAILSTAETRQVNNDYTQFHGQFFRIATASIVAGLRGAAVRVEKRLNGEICARFRQRYPAITAIHQRPTPAKPAAQSPPGAGKHPGPSPAMRTVMKNLLRKPGMPVWMAGRIDNSRTAGPSD
jgi:hypothetical protein